MKKTTLLLLIVSLLLPEWLSAGRCTGSSFCRACTTCNYCKHCNGGGGTCGVCGGGNASYSSENIDKDKSSNDNNRYTGNSSYKNDTTGTVQNYYSNTSINSNKEGGYWWLWIILTIVLLFAVNKHDPGRR